MKLSLQLSFAAFIAWSLFLIYAAWRKGWGEKHFDVAKRSLPSFLMWPKTVEAYVAWYKAHAIFSLVLGIAVLVYVSAQFP